MITSDNNVDPGHCTEKQMDGCWIDVLLILWYCDGGMGGKDLYDDKYYTRITQKQNQEGKLCNEAARLVYVNG